MNKLRLWEELLLFVGFGYTQIQAKILPFAVKVHHNGPGRISFGDGETLADAIENAALGMGIDWESVKRKLTEYYWNQMAHN